MPWLNGDYPPSYKNQPKKIRDKATEIANEVLKTTGNEGEAIATGLKQARALAKIAKIRRRAPASLCRSAYLPTTRNRSPRS